MRNSTHLLFIYVYAQQRTPRPAHAHIYARWRTSVVIHIHISARWHTSLFHLRLLCATARISGYGGYMFIFVFQQSHNFSSHVFVSTVFQPPQNSISRHLTRLI
jgi:hypothetical protein